MEALLVVGGFIAAAGLLWLTPKIDPDRPVEEPSAQAVTDPPPALDGPGVLEPALR
ncbi:hypothetical protein GHK86_11185 [Acidimicrobiaceae bacterium USS-CC1]|uniref:Uncharacterized protein n=1 Tax=Acidiferrimicrobium australe TaxID=2664430 RepID=A0ABW9QTV5_9ACTN|nr:hypothetical protein [Acidiferrimicrobium australe]